MSGWAVSGWVRVSGTDEQDIDAQAFGVECILYIYIYIYIERHAYVRCWCMLVPLSTRSFCMKSIAVSLEI